MEVHKDRCLTVSIVDDARQVLQGRLIRQKFNEIWRLMSAYHGDSSVGLIDKRRLPASKAIGWYMIGTAVEQADTSGFHLEVVK
jgi:hypothetical protein